MSTHAIQIHLTDLLALAEKPPLYTGGDTFWQDPYIAARLLEAHLDPSVDAASKKPGTIDREVRFIAESLGLTHTHSLIDLGCGPGLYCEGFARHCGRVTGMDFSRNSIDYAVDSARRRGLDITYIHENYVEMDAQPVYDAACMINYDFGALWEDDRHRLLDRIHRALKPGGFFVFDVLTPAYRDDAPPVNWQGSPGGFWSPDAHLVLEKRFAYPEERVRLTQHIVFTEDGHAVYRFYDTFFTIDRARSLLDRHGFRLAHAYGDLSGAPLSGDAQTLGVFAQKAG